MLEFCSALIMSAVELAGDALADVDINGAASTAKARAAPAMVILESFFMM